VQISAGSIEFSSVTELVGNDSLIFFTKNNQTFSELIINNSTAMIGCNIIVKFFNAIFACKKQAQTS